MPDQSSQISFETNDKGVRCLVYRKDCCTKTHDGGIKDMHNERKIVWVYPNRHDVTRCPVRLIQKYLSLCPKVTKKANFYLQSRQRPSPIQWYQEQVVGQNTIGKVVKELMNDGEIPGFFTNHSTHRTGSTRLFRAGVQCKLVKETTGHKSDAIDKYQITSDEQREVMSDIIARPVPNVVKELPKTQLVVNQTDKVTSNVTITSNGSEQNDKVTIDGSNVGELVTKIIDQSAKRGKSTVKIKIVVINE